MVGTVLVHFVATVEVEMGYEAARVCTRLEMRIQRMMWTTENGNRLHIAAYTAIYEVSSPVDLTSVET